MQYKYDENDYPVTKKVSKFPKNFSKNNQHNFFMLNDTPTNTSMIVLIIFELALHVLETLQKLFKISFNTPKQ